MDQTIETELSKTMRIEYNFLISKILKNFKFQVQNYTDIER